MDNILNKDLYEYTLDNGLKIKIIEKEGFRSSYCLLKTNFGSMYNEFICDNKKYTIPHGVAHFLEHKLFKTDSDTEANSIFDNLGLYCNAFTSYFQTCYHFYGNSNIEKGINLLLDFTQKPYFTKENVENEKPIIKEEILSYKDNPSIKIFEELKNDLFDTYPIKYDICGEIKDVESITKEDLDFAYDCFYHPSNMTFYYIGPMDKDYIYNIIKENQSKKVFNKGKDIKIILDEKMDDKYSLRRVPFDIKVSKALLGIKLPFNKNDKVHNEILRYDMIIKFINNLVFGSNTRFYKKLIDKKIVLNGYFMDSCTDYYSGYIYLGCDTDKPDKFIKYIKRRIKFIDFIIFKNKPIERIKKNLIGEFIFDLNDSVEILDWVNMVDDVNSSYLDTLSIIDSISKKDLYKNKKLFKGCLKAVILEKKEK